MATVKHLDETGFQIGGKTRWLHIASTVFLTFYRVAANRGNVLLGVVGTVNQTKLKPQTLEFAKYIMVLTTLQKEKWPIEKVLELYRFRWQVELAFKRFKSLAHLGHLPKSNARSSRTWLYTKLFVCLLTEKLVAKADSFSPWGPITRF
ncbi:MAG: transposase [Magnetococcales bacterium]|nr:transposase [Magnetococcales bacterium]MBF0116687.1 transposase [Magnetococcales bacterium]